MAKRVPSAKAVAVVDDALLEQFKDFPGIKVIERRLQNPDLPGTLPIRLKDEPTHIEDPQSKKRLWYVRWINGGQEGRSTTVTDALGYVPVQIEELQNPNMLAGIQKTSQDGVVRRGDHGQEWLAKMPLQLYNAIKAKQQEIRRRRDRNAKFVKDDLANAAGREMGSEAGDTIHDEFSVEITRSKSTYGAELIDEA
jgi:hypothetical protein